MTVTGLHFYRPKFYWDNSIPTSLHLKGQSQNKIKQITGQFLENCIESVFILDAQKGIETQTFQIKQNYNRSTIIYQDKLENL